MPPPTTRRLERRIIKAFPVRRDRIALCLPLPSLCADNDDKAARTAVQACDDMWPRNVLVFMHRSWRRHTSESPEVYMSIVAKEGRSVVWPEKAVGLVSGSFWRLLRYTPPSPTPPISDISNGPKSPGADASWRPYDFVWESGTQRGRTPCNPHFARKSGSWTQQHQMIQESKENDRLSGVKLRDEEEIDQESSPIARFGRGPSGALELGARHHRNTVRRTLLRQQE